MINEYISEAIKTAKYEFLEDSNTIYGEIPLCHGVYARANSFEECRRELIDVLEEWLLIRIKNNLEIFPV